MSSKQTVVLGSILALVGSILSGPVGLLVVATTHPQPSWSTPTTFVESYHWVQTLPYFAGFVLVTGFAILIPGLCHRVWNSNGARCLGGVVFVAVFSSMVFTNYVLQTTVVPNMAMSKSAVDEMLLSSLTMSNPKSIAWALEMWGYAALGVATWLSAVAFSGSRSGRIARGLYVANGPVSILGGLVTAIVPGWVLTPAGLVAFVAWNAMIIVALGFTIVVAWKQWPAA